MIDDKTLAELEELEKAATPGPWFVGLFADGSPTGTLHAPHENSPNIVFSSNELYFFSYIRNHAKELIAAAKRERILREAFEDVACESCHHRCSVCVAREALSKLEAM